MIFGVLAIVVALVIAYLQRRSKRLGWGLQFDVPLISGNPDTGGDSKLEVSWEGERLNRPRFISLRLMNNGRREIRIDDWSTPLTITIRGATIRSALTDAWSKGVLDRTEELEIEGSAAILKPLLLNPRDWVELSLIVDGASESHVTVEARVAGETRPISSSGSAPGLKGPLFFTLSMLFVSVALALINHALYPKFHLLKNAVANNLLSTTQATILFALSGFCLFLYRCVKRARWSARD